MERIEEKPKLCALQPLEVFKAQAAVHIGHPRQNKTSEDDQVWPMGWQLCPQTSKCQFHSIKRRC